MGIRAAIYLRISLDAAGDGLAIERQREDCEAIAAERGWQVVDIYVDQSISATDASVTRPAYDRLVRDVDAGLIDAVICWDLDRLTRQPRQLEDWIDRAEQRHLILVTANGDADLTTDGGKMYARMKAVVGRAEVERKSARQRRAQRQRAEMGRPPAGVRPMGYRLDGVVIEDEAVVVRGIAAAVLAGSSLRDIARALSGEKPRRHGDAELPDLPVTPRHTHTLALERNARRRSRGEPERPVPAAGPWSPSTILSILRNPRLAGYSVYRPQADEGRGRWRGWRDAIVRDDSGEPVRGQWEPILDEDTWWRVQETLDDPARVTNRTASTARRWLGSGLFRCGDCGDLMRTHGDRYRCRRGCLLRSRRQVDAAVIAVVRARLARPDIADLLPVPDAPELAAIDAELSERRARLARAQHDYDSEVIEGIDLKRIRRRERPAIEALERRRLALTAGAELGPVLGAPDPVAAFDGASLDVRRGVIDALCEVRLHRGVRGRRAFDPATVEIIWRGAGE